MSRAAIERSRSATAPGLAYRAGMLSHQASFRLAAGRLRAAKHAAGAAVAFAYAAAVLFGVPGHMAAGDSLYHFSVASSIWHGDLAPDPSRTFPWGLWRDLPVDHYWGFHLIVAPFAAVAAPEMGMKLAASVLFACFVAAMALIVERRGAWLPWAWAAATVLVVDGQDWRYLQLRGGVLMATALLAFLEVAFFVDDDRKRRVALVAIAGASSLAYNGAFVLAPLHVAGLVGLALLPDRSAARARIFEPLLTLFGLVAGLVVNPYFDRNLSTFRFAFVNVWVIGRDRAGLFAGQENLEVNPFPLSMLAADWGWVILLALVLSASGTIAVRLGRRRPVERDEVVYGSLALAGIVLTARMLRLREYSVPLAMVFLAVFFRPLSGWARGPRMRGAGAAVAFVLVLAAGLREVPSTKSTIARAHPPIDLFGGARAVLEAHGGVPVANLVLGDGNLLLWEWPEVTVAQGGSPYFSYLVDRALYDDLRTLREVPGDEVALAALDRLRDRGVRLVSARASLGFHPFAARHPERLRRVYVHAKHRACLYEIVDIVTP